jgi:hypothetical protein
MNNLGHLDWNQTAPRDFEQPVIHRECGWCGASLGDLICLPTDPNAGKTTTGICERCLGGVLKRADDLGGKQA